MAGPRHPGTLQSIGIGRRDYRDRKALIKSLDIVFVHANPREILPQLTFGPTSKYDP